MHDECPADLSVVFEETAEAATFDAVVAAACVGDLLTWFAKGVELDATARLVFSPSLSKEARAAVRKVIDARGLAGTLDCQSDGVAEERCLVVYCKGAAPAKPAISAEDAKRAGLLYRLAKAAGMQPAPSRDDIAQQLARGQLSPALAALWQARSSQQEGVAALRAAVEQDDGDAVAALLAQEPALANAADDETGQSPLHGAARTGALGALRALLAGGAALEDKDARGRTALQLARTFEQCDAEALLLQAGAHDPEAGLFPLTQAVANLGLGASAAAQGAGKLAHTAAQEEQQQQQQEEEGSDGELAVLAQQEEAATEPSTNGNHPPASQLPGGAAAEARELAGTAAAGATAAAAGGEEEEEPVSAPQQLGVCEPDAVAAAQEDAGPAPDADAPEPEPEVEQEPESSQHSASAAPVEAATMGLPAASSMQEAPAPAPAPEACSRATATSTPPPAEAPVPAAAAQVHAAPPPTAPAACAVNGTSPAAHCKPAADSSTEALTNGVGATAAVKDLQKQRQQQQRAAAAAEAAIVSGSASGGAGEGGCCGAGSGSVVDMVSGWAQAVQQQVQQQPLLVAGIAGAGIVLALMLASGARRRR